ncbi:hypothetical protein [Sorangium sp. So ce513]|uniref:hypothetical protein n=1 Tax=Sorangium sp. So ce513 TaxID=3133315 RepID=UPI003F5ECCD1
MLQGRITAVATYLPERVVSNHELVTSYGLPCSADWLQRATGIVERRFAGVAETTLSMAAAVLRQLIEAGQLRDPFIDLLVMTSDDGARGDGDTAAFAACMAGLSPALVLDLPSAQGGLAAALHVANRHLDRGSRRALVVASEVRSWRLRAGQPWVGHDLEAVLGDGAVGVLLERGDGLADARGAGLLGSRVAAPLLASHVATPLLASRVAAPLLGSHVATPLLGSRVAAPLLASHVAAPLLTAPHASRG